MDGPMYIALCDDVASDAQAIARCVCEYLDREELYAKLDTFPSGEALLESGPEKYSLAILDIYMGGINGMETARALLRTNKRLQVIFASSSIDFAAEAFSIDALHYIVKPVDKEQLFRALDRFFESHYAMKTVAVKAGRLEEHIYLSDILYIEAEGKRSKIHLKQGVLEVSQSLSQMAALLPPGDFCNPIRWALVSMREISAVPGAAVKLSDGTEIPVSRSKREEIRDAYARFRWDGIRRKMRGR